MNDFKMANEIVDDKNIDNNNESGGENVENVLKMLNQKDSQNMSTIEVMKAFGKEEENSLNNCGDRSIEGKNIMRYTRTILHQLRNLEKSRNRPNCILKSKLQLLPIWTCRVWKTSSGEGHCDNDSKSVCYDNYVENNGSNSGVGMAGSNNSTACMKDVFNCEGSGHSNHNNSNYGHNGTSLKSHSHVLSDLSTYTGNNKQRQMRSTMRSIYHRGRFNSGNFSLMYSTTTMNNNNSNNNNSCNHNSGGKSHNINSNTKYFVDQRSISSAHLMPAFAKKYMRNTMTTNNVDIDTDITATKTNNSNNKSNNNNGKGNENNPLPSLHNVNKPDMSDAGDVDSFLKNDLDIRSRYNSNGESHPYWTPLLNRLQTKLNVPYNNNNKNIISNSNNNSNNNCNENNNKENNNNNSNNNNDNKSNNSIKSNTNSNNNNNDTNNSNNNSSNVGNKRSERRIGSGRLVNRDNNWDYRTNCKDKNYYPGSNIECNTNALHSNTERQIRNGDGTESGNICGGRTHVREETGAERDNNRVQDHLRMVECRPYDRRLLDNSSSILREKYDNKDNNIGMPSLRRFTAINTTAAHMNNALTNTKVAAINNKFNDDNTEINHINIETNMNTHGNYIYHQSHTRSNSQPIDTHLVQKTMSFRRSHQSDKKEKFKLKEKKREEPEWFTSGPTTQHETIPLHGFHCDGDTGALNLSNNKNNEISSINTNDSDKKIQDISLPSTYQSDQMHNKAKEALDSTATTADNNVTTDIVASDISNIITMNPLNVETNVDHTHSSPPSNSVNELLNFFDMDALEYSLIETDKHKHFGQSSAVTSRFSRWFTNPEKTIHHINNDFVGDIEIEKDMKNETSSSFVINKESSNKTNTVMAFFKSNDFSMPDMPKALPRSVLALSVEELESRMRLIDSASENIKPNNTSRDARTQRDGLSGEECKRNNQSSPSKSTTILDTSRTNNNQDVEVFKRILNQLGGTVGDNEKSLNDLTLPRPSYHASPLTNCFILESSNFDSEEIDSENNTNTTIANVKQKDIPKLSQQQQPLLHQQKLRQVHQQRKNIPTSSHNHDNENRSAPHTLSLQPLYNQHYSLPPYSNTNHQNNQNGGQKQDGPLPLDMHHAQSLMQNTLLKKKMEEKQQQELFMTQWQELHDQQQRQTGLDANNTMLSSNINLTADSMNSNNNVTQNLMQQQQQSFRVHVCSSPTPMAFTPTSVLRKMTAEKDNFQQQQMHMLQQHQQAQTNAHQFPVDPLLNHDNVKTCVMQQQQTRLSQPRLILGGGGSGAGGNGNPANIQCQQQQIQSSFLQHQLSTKMPAQPPQSDISPQHVQHQHQTKGGGQGRNGPLLKWSPAPVNPNVLINKPIGRPILKGPPLIPNTIPSSNSGHHKTHLSTPQHSQQQLSKSVQFSQAQQQQFSLIQHMSGGTISNKTEFQLLPKMKANPPPFNVQHASTVVGNASHQPYQPEHRHNNNIRQTPDHSLHQPFNTIQLQQQQHYHYQQQQQFQQRSLTLKQKLHQQLQQQHISQQDSSIVLQSTNQTQQQGVANSLNNTSVTNLNYQRDGRLSPTSNQLAQWFSPELLAQASAGKLPLLNMNQALSLEEFERSIQHSSSTVMQN